MVTVLPRGTRVPISGLVHVKLAHLEARLVVSLNKLHAKGAAALLGQVIHDLSTDPVQIPLILTVIFGIFTGDPTAAP